jgi:hypothetical protein
VASIRLLPMLIYIVGFEILTALVMKRSVIWNIMPCSLLKVNWCFKGICWLRLQGQWNSRALLATCLLHTCCLAYYLTLKMVACYSEKLGDFQQTTRHFIPEHTVLLIYNIDYEDTENYCCMFASSTHCFRYPRMQ